MADREKVFDALRCCITEGKCRNCPWEDCEKVGSKRAIVPVTLMLDALNLLKEQQETIVSLQSTISKLTKALAEQPEQKFFVDSDRKMTPLPIQKPGHWKGFTQSRYFGMDDDGEPIFRDGVFYVCSECRRKSIIKYPYCPRCGAKMDEEVKQDDRA